MSEVCLFFILPYFQYLPGFTLIFSLSAQWKVTVHFISFAKFTPQLIGPIHSEQLKYSNKLFLYLNWPNSLEKINCNITAVYPTIIIIGDVWNTEFDTLWLSPRSVKSADQTWQMAPWQKAGGLRINNSGVSLWSLVPCTGSNQIGKGCFPPWSSERNTACCTSAEF